MTLDPRSGPQPGKPRNVFLPCLTVDKIQIYSKAGKMYTVRMPVYEFRVRNLTTDFSGYKR